MQQEQDVTNPHAFQDVRQAIPLSVIEKQKFSEMNSVTQLSAQKVESKRRLLPDNTKEVYECGDLKYKKPWDRKDIVKLANQNVYEV